MEVRKPSGGKCTALLIASVVLPLAALVVELTWRLCAEVLFDPLPTLGHVLLVVLVPVANGLALAAAYGRSPFGERIVGVAQAMALAVSAVYALLFAPVTPIAGMAILYFGFGLLPLAPLLSLVAGGLVRRSAHRALGRPLPGLGTGLALGLLVLLVAELPVGLTRMALQVAASPDEEVRERGVGWLRAIGHEETMLRACLWRPGGDWGLVGFAVAALGRPVSTDEARRIYYRVHGRPFEKSPTPLQRAGLFREGTEWDEGVGGDVVAGRASGVSLASSRIDGSVDTRAGLAYLEWTLTVRNDSPRIREARALLALPEGAVVTRATLWIDGEPREAAFGGRAAVRAAYTAVVRKSRDPLLVTTRGDGRVLVQCFPIQPRGEMKIRIGVTTPFALDGTRAALRLPFLLDENFVVDASLRHAVWIESDSGALTGSQALHREPLGEAGVALRGELEDGMLRDGSPQLEIPRASLAEEVWARDVVTNAVAAAVQDVVAEGVVAPDATSAGQTSDAAAPLWIRQRIVAEAWPRASRPRGFVLAIDLSAGMGPELAAVADALRENPTGLPIRVVADDPRTDQAGLRAGLDVSGGRRVEAKRGQGRADGSPEAYAAAAEIVADLVAEGGRDNVALLSRAWDLAAARPGEVVIWVHAAQGMRLDPVDGLRQRLDRRPGAVRIFELQVGSGEDRVVADLDGAPGIVPIPPLESPAADLARLLGRLASHGRAERFDRQAAVPGTEPPTVLTSRHLVRLWARERVEERLAAGDRVTATAEAVRYQLVTPVSGAVVLETAAQYDAAGLRPVEPGTVPTVPEPETWALLAMLSILLGWRTLQACRAPREVTSG